MFENFVTRLTLEVIALAWVYQAMLVCWATDWEGGANHEA